jgi:decaprenyl-phosphate phosphoribosyltransferase
MFLAMQPFSFMRNAILLVPLIFSEKLFDGIVLFQWLLALLIFTALFGATQIINELRKVWENKLISVGYIRMTPKDQITINRAEFICGLIVIVALVGAFLLGTKIGLIALCYFLLQVLYYLFLQKVTILDFLTLPLVYTLSVMGTGYLIWYYVSPWLLCSVLTFMIFLNLGQLKNESLTMSSPYSPEFFDHMLSFTATTTVVLYSLYAFLSSQVTYEFQTPLLILTIPFIIAIIGRYFYLMYQEKNPELFELRVILDLPMIWTVIGWSTVSILVIYTGI